MIGKATITRATEEGEIRFRKITVYERARLLELLEKRRRAKLLENLRDAGATKEEILGELEGLETPGEKDWLAWLNLPEGKAEIILSALRAEYGEGAEEKLSNFTPSFEEELNLVAELVGMPIQSEQPSTNEALTYSQEGEPAGAAHPLEAAETYSTPPATKT
jgi:hypothetical protein